MGGFWGVCMAIFMAAYALHLHPEGGAVIVVVQICIALLIATAYGLVMATALRSRARKANLPSWDEISVPDR